MQCFKTCFLNQGKLTNFIFPIEVSGRFLVGGGNGGG